MAYSAQLGEHCLCRRLESRPREPAVRRGMAVWGFQHYRRPAEADSVDMQLQGSGEDGDADAEEEGRGSDQFDQGDDCAGW